MRKVTFLLIMAVFAISVTTTLAAVFYFADLSESSSYGVSGSPLTTGSVADSSPLPTVGATSTAPSVPDAVLPPENIDDSTSEELIDAYKVFVNGDVVGIVSSEDELDKMMSDLLDNYKNENNVDDVVYEFTKDIQIKKVQTFAHNITANQTVENAISGCMVFKVNAYELSIARYHLGYYATEQECLEILQSAKDKFVSLNMSGKNVLSISFDSEFDINEVYILSEDIGDTLPEDAVEKILSDRKVDKYYAVTDKEYLDSLYAKFEVNIDYSVAAAGLEVNGIVDVAIEDRIVNFVVKTARSTVETLPYSSLTKTNTSLLYNVKRTAVKGVNGSVTTNYEETYVNGECVSTVKISTKEVKPVNEVIEYGTKLQRGVHVTAKTGLGRFILPTGGKITGLYGETSNVIQNYIHTGIDIAALRGTPIYASADGVIEEAGYDMLVRGYYVKIKHDSTYTTQYLHMNRYCVSAGQKVKQGDIIGYVGDSGVATGCHCHFAVLKNGLFVDPCTVLYGYAG